MAQSEEWTFGRLLQWTADFLQQRGSGNARLDAEVLLAHAAGCQRIELYTRFNDVADESLRQSFRALVKRRAEGVPVAYLVGRREFYSMTFEVTPAVLIPRPETELLVIETLDLLKQPPYVDRPVSILDVGTGSGVIAVCLAKHAPQCRVTAVDVSGEALEVAGRNASRHAVEDRIEWLQSDLMEALPEDARYDFVLSNPPYVTEAEFAALPPEIRECEPELALRAGDDGLAVIRKLVPQAAAHLQPGGALLFEISPMLARLVLDLFAGQSEWREVEILNDLAGLSRVVRAFKQG